MFVYALVNESMPGIVKLGISEDPRYRAQQLSKTSVPTPWTVKRQWKSDNARAAEEWLFRRFSDLRVTSRREFFTITFTQLGKEIRVMKKYRMVK